MDEKPRCRPQQANSSLVVACRAIREEKADAVVSAATPRDARCVPAEIRRIPGVRRPRSRTIRTSRPSVLLDSAPKPTTPETSQFAHMGTLCGGILALQIRDRLLSIGESRRRNQLALEAHELLAASAPQLCRTRRTRLLSVRPTSSSATAHRKRRSQVTRDDQEISRTPPEITHLAGNRVS